jgi:Nucleotidyl transferase AbiEii toxin, Type IV TA system
VASHLVLRGSVLAKAWFGACAREPADLDFVVDYQRTRPDEPTLGEMFDDIVADAAAMSHRPGSTVFINHRPAWTELLDRDTVYAVSGNRLLLTWHGRGHVGILQMDFAVDDVLHDPPELTPIPRSSLPGPPIMLRAATKRQPLAWKIAWLMADSPTLGDPDHPMPEAHGAAPEANHAVLEEDDDYDYYEEDHAGKEPALPLGKDLYDAVLLAEQCLLPGEFLDETLRSRIPVALRPPVRFPCDDRHLTVSSSETEEGRLELPQAHHLTTV